MCDVDQQRPLVSTVKTSTSHKRQEISCPAERLPASKEELCSTGSDLFAEIYSDE